MAYDNTNRGAIWKNRDKTEDKHPDFKGSLNVEGVEYWVSAWKRKEGEAGNKPALSFSIKPKEEKQPEPAAKPTRQHQDMNDEIPFQESPAELQDARLKDLQAENERLRKDNEWLRR